MRLNLLAILIWLAQWSWLTSTYNGGDLRARDALPAPISVPPSQDFDGNDGPWSSFTVQVGSPTQNLRLFISTALSTTWVIIPAGCPASDTACPNDRGGIYNASRSSTWMQQGEYQLNAAENPNVTSYGLFGNDTVGLEIQGNAGPILPNQIIGGIAAEQLWLGLFGLNRKPTFFNSSNPNQPSYTSTLRQQNLIPSLAYGYTAGNKYSLKTVLGSLTLGGYDSARFAPNDVTFQVASDDSRDLVVGIQAINSVDTTGKSYDLLGITPGIMAYIDSTLAELWLPATSCAAFETAFGLVYDPVNKLYPVNSTLHAALQTLNPNVTITLGTGISGGSTVNIVLPYAAFDLEASWPKYPNGTLYFPLQRAENSSQYTLGRTFLQEAYIIVDYERNNFSVSQCIFPENLSSSIVAISAPSNSTTDSTSSPSTSSTTPDSNKTIGIAVGVALGLLLIISTIAIYLIVRRRSFRYSSTHSFHRPSLPKFSFRSLLSRLGFSSSILHPYRPPKVELNTDVENSRFEAPGSEPPKPISETSTLLTEPLFADQVLPVSELHSHDRPVVAELHSPTPVLYHFPLSAIELPTALDSAHTLPNPSHITSPITGPLDETRIRYALSDPVAGTRVEGRRAPARNLSDRPLLHMRQSTLESVVSGPSALSGSAGAGTPSEVELEEGFFSPISPVGEGKEWLSGGR